MCSQQIMQRISPRQKKGKCDGHGDHWIYSFTSTRCTDWNIFSRICRLACHFSHHCNRNRFSLVSSVSIITAYGGHSHVPFKQQMQILQDRRVLSGLATTAFWISGYTMVFAYISPLLRQTSGFTLEMTSIALLVLGISAFIGSRFGGYAVDQWGPNRTISISITVQMLMLFALSFTQFSVVGVFITLAIWGTATWTTTPAKQFYLISLKPETSETVLSFNTAIMNIGMMLGSSMGGLIIQYTNVTNLSWIGGLASFVALMLIRYSFNRHRLAHQQIKSEHV